jgi:hypothetical protein
MVTRSSLPARRRQSGALTTDVVIAMGILTLVMMPLVLSVLQERRLLRSYYTDAIAMEIVDGEMDALRAGEWRAFQPGAQAYAVGAAAATNLPPGRFVLTLATNRVRLEWTPTKPGRSRAVIREARLP